MSSILDHFWKPELFITMSHWEQEQEAEREFNGRAKDQFFKTNRVLLTTMISFFFITIVVLFLYIYVKCIILRQSIRRAAILQVSTGTVSVVHAHQPLETQGLDSMVIARLPIILYKKPDEKAEECSVCLSFLEEEEIVRVLPNCNHTFHAKCIDMWFMANSTCPICRTEAQPRVLLEPSSNSEDDQSIV